MDRHRREIFLNGAGNFLRGTAWYEVGSAEARAIDANTARTIDDWNRRVYENYKRELSEHYARIVRKTNALQDRGAEHQFKLRTDPKDKEVRSGEALNALVVDLSSPNITETQWRAAKVELTKELSIPNLMFKLVSTTAAKDKDPATRCVIALARLDREGKCPICLRDDAVTAERTAYEKAYQDVKEKSNQKNLDLATVIRMDKAIERLKAKVNRDIPVERDFRNQANKFVAEMEPATAMFNGALIDFAQEMIRDTTDHQARTVAQLLAFMRKYRLFFADAGDNPEVGELYSKLYPLLRAQKEALGLKAEPPPRAEPPRVAAPVRSAVGRWSHVNRATEYVNEVFLHPGGQMTTSRTGPGTWRQNGLNLILYVEDRGAPGGTRAISLTLSQDGTTYAGQNFKGEPLSGTRIPD